jgi:superfamily II DNA/RNA helicase
LLLAEGGHDADEAQVAVSNMLEDNTAGHEADILLDVEEFSAWREFRLHPLLEKAIWALGFKEPTPIQKLCIPAAAHQGKVNFLRFQEC